MNERWNLDPIYPGFDAPAFEEDMLALKAEVEKITAFLRGKLGQNWTDKELKRAIDAAMRRGHSYGAIRQALANMEADHDDFPEEW